MIRSDGITQYTSHCDMDSASDDGVAGGWTVVFRFDRSVSRTALFEQYTSNGQLQNMGTATSTTGTFTRSMPSTLFDEVAVGCYDSAMNALPGTFRTESNWIVGKSFIAGEESLSSMNRQQSNTFGHTNGYETLMWATSTDWREINFIDNSDTTSTSTSGSGYIVWKSGSGGFEGECNDAAVSTSNQLVLLARIKPSPRPSGSPTPAPSTPPPSTVPTSAPTEVWTQIFMELAALRQQVAALQSQVAVLEANNQCAVSRFTDGGQGCLITVGNGTASKLKVGMEGFEGTQLIQ